jgi:2-oxo-3-hexenedioate decarboxylase
MSELGDRLVHAVRTRSALDPQGSGLDADAAYDIQEEVVAALGPETVAAKLGLTSRAKQIQMKVDEPLYGWMVRGTEIMRGDPLDTSQLIQPRVEPEIAFVTGDELTGPDVTAARVLAATTAVTPAIDVLDSRYAGYSFTLPDVIADNSSAGRFTVGDPLPPDGVDLRTVGCVFSKNGEMVATAAGAAIMGHPAEAVAWFVRKLARRGKVLPAGTLVLAGALTAAVPAEPGDVFTVEIDRLGTLDLAVT